MVVSRHESDPQVLPRRILEDNAGDLQPSRKIVVRVGSSYGLGLRKSDTDAPALTELPSWNQLKFELWLQWELAAPLLVQGVLQVFLGLVSIMFVGRLGELELASASLGISLYNATGYWIMLGSVGAMETLCGQAFGAKQYHKLGEVLQRALFVNTVLCGPVMILWMYAEEILLALGQEPHIADATTRFLYGLFPALFGAAWGMPLVKYLQTQNIVRPLAVCSGLTLAVHVPVTYALVFSLGLGFMGAAYATSISQLVFFFLLLGSIYISGAHKKTWGGWSRRAMFSDVSELWEYVRLAFPSAIMTCLESWVYELALFLAGLLPNPAVQLSAINILTNTTMLTFMLAVAWSAAVSVRVANELGANSPERARLAVLASRVTSVVTAAAVAITLFACRHVWGYIFTDDVPVIKLTASLLPLLSISAATDILQYTMSGVLRGSGKQDFGALCNFLSYYLVGIPMLVFLGFYCNLEAMGVWSGLLMGVLANLVIYSILTSMIDWKKEAETALSRTGGLDTHLLG
ncbi:MATE efflux family protein [Klebsormidium nitens]|uniref:Protein DETOXIFICATION n=1 Tax=Klebsormidium nitens TaxID=105231 RepID=A0A1Y1I359_KLENI|nr:MATE efflux family protein [Klebsormidium nitens]|eukprot:GAQ85370.1 MATE efflux family protein [Klebsormidium nitens]